MKGGLINQLFKIVMTSGVVFVLQVLYDNENGETGFLSSTFTLRGKIIHIKGAKENLYQFLTHLKRLVLMDPADFPLQVGALTGNVSISRGAHEIFLSTGCLMRLI